MLALAARYKLRPQAFFQLISLNEPTTGIAIPGCWFYLIVPENKN
jgi:hypothetical protein